MKKVKRLLFFVGILFIFNGCGIITWVPYDGPPIAEYYPYGEPVQRNFSNPPIDPGIPWQYWYITPVYPGAVFFFGSDGNHHYYERGHGHNRRH